MWSLIIYYLGLKLYTGVFVCVCVCMYVCVLGECVCERLAVLSYPRTLTQKDCGKIILENFPLPQL